MPGSISISTSALAEAKRRGGRTQPAACGGIGALRRARGGRRSGRRGRLRQLEAEGTHPRKVLAARACPRGAPPSVAVELLRGAATADLDRDRALRRRLAHEPRSCAALRTASPSKRTITSPCLIPAFSAGLSFSTERTLAPRASPSTSSSPTPRKALPPASWRMTTLRSTFGASPSLVRVRRDGRPRASSTCCVVVSAVALPSSAPTAARAARPRKAIAVMPAAQVTVRFMSPPSLPLSPPWTQQGEEKSAANGTLLGSG